jgi:excisionase family DNA binding protein
MTDLLVEAIRSAVRAEIDASLAAHLEPLVAALRAATPPARGLSPAEYAAQHGISVWTCRRLVADGSLPHSRLGKRICIPADAVPGTAEADRIGELAAAAMEARRG